MSALALTPQARACSAWARPISPPSTVTAALFDMFCGLNGLTWRPRRLKARARPATRSDLPTSEPVPWIISAGTRAGRRMVALLWSKRSFQGVGLRIADAAVDQDLLRAHLLSVIHFGIALRGLDHGAFERRTAG